MRDLFTIAFEVILLAFMLGLLSMVLSGCVVTPAGYRDRDHDGVYYHHEYDRGFGYHGGYGYQERDHGG